MDYDEPEIVGFPAHEPLAPSQSGRNAMAKSNDPELKRRWEHLGKTGWQLKTATVNPSTTLGQVEVVYVFEHCH